MRYAKTILILAALSAVACSGSGSGADAEVIDDGGASALAASFDPDEPNPGARTVSMAEGNKSGNLISLAVNVTGIENVIGAAFDVTFDADLVTWVAPWSPGTLLESAGAPVFYDVSLSQPGRLVVGASVFGSTAASATGTQPLIFLTFRVLGEGGSTIGFDNATLQDDQSPPQDVSGLNPWAGGALIAL